LDRKKACSHFVEAIPPFRATVLPAISHHFLPARQPPAILLNAKKAPMWKVQGRRGRMLRAMKIGGI
jgi:hypothetical protein